MSVAVSGVKVMQIGGFSVTVAALDLVGSATLFAVIATSCCESILDGAVYSPDGERVPNIGLIDQVTFVFVPALLTEALNCCVCPGVMETDAGLTDTLIGGLSVITAVAVLLVSAALLAVIVTFCCELTVGGAVYRPEEDISPRLGSRDQVTVVLVAFKTVAVIC